MTIDASFFCLACFAALTAVVAVGFGVDAVRREFVSGRTVDVTLDAHKIAFVIAAVEFAFVAVGETVGLAFAFSIAEPTVEGIQLGNALHGTVYGTHLRRWIDAFADITLIAVGCGSACLAFVTCSKFAASGIFDQMGSARFGIERRNALRGIASLRNTPDLIRGAGAYAIFTYSFSGFAVFTFKVLVIGITA